MLLHPTTQSVLDATTENLVHAVLMSGPEGAGKFYVAQQFAMRKLGLPNLESLQNYPHIHVIEPEKQSISIEQIRSVQKFLQLKTPGTNQIRRVVLVRDAHLMTAEGQNALLKSLEEPPADTIFVLTAPANLRLKETIYSRVQTVTILPVTEQTALEYYHGSALAADIKKAHLLSNGYVGLLHALVHDSEHPLITQITQAKQLMSATVFERLCEVDVIAKQKEAVPGLLQACKLICRSALYQNASHSGDMTRKWHDRLSLVYRCETSLDKSSNTKLLLTHLFLEL